MATEKEDDDFESCLDEASKKKAKDELFERNDADRRLAVQTFRKWILQQEWLKTPTDFRFLLRFLRVRKFSQLEARETLKNYWTTKLKKSKWFDDLDPADPKIQEIFRAKTYYSPLKYDKNGCRWMYTPFGRITPARIDSWGLTNIYRAMVLFIEWVCYDENVQVNGLRWFIDYTGLHIGTVSRFSKPDDQKHLNHYLQRSSPARMKAFYLFNEPGFFDMIYAMFSVFSRKKTLDRIQMVGNNMAKVYEIADKSILPTDYLPDDYKGPSAGSESDIIEAMLADMTSPKFRNYIRDLSSSKYGIDERKRPKNDEEPAASFRKLNVD